MSEEEDSMWQESPEKTRDYLPRARALSNRQASQPASAATNAPLPNNASEAWPSTP